MGSEDVKRQALNVYRMKLLGATRGAGRERARKTLKDALNEAMRDWVTNVENTFYIIGTVAGPHPYPMMVRDFQSVIGDEACVQMPELAGRQPDAVIACVGGGSNAMGIFYPYIAHERRAPDRRRGGGRGPRDAASTRRRSPRGSARRAARQPHLPAAGRRTARSSRRIRSRPASTIPGVGPEHAWLQGHRPRRVRRRSPTTRRSRRSTTCCRTEGIIPALESSHAVAYAMKLAPTHAEGPDPARQPLGPRRQGHRAPSPSARASISTTARDRGRARMRAVTTASTPTFARCSAQAARR